MLGAMLTLSRIDGGWPPCLFSEKRGRLIQAAYKTAVDIAGVIRAGARVVANNSKLFDMLVSSVMHTSDEQETGASVGAGRLSEVERAATQAASLDEWEREGRLR